jgi:hypothetical protein
MPPDVLGQIRGMIQSSDAASKPSAQRSPPACVDSVAKKQRVMSAPPADSDSLPQGVLIGHFCDDYQSLFQSPRNERYHPGSPQPWTSQIAMRMSSRREAARQARMLAARHPGTEVSFRSFCNLTFISARFGSRSCVEGKGQSRSQATESAKLR